MSVPRLGVGIDRARLYRPYTARSVDPFDVVSVKNAYAPHFLWSDRHNPQTQIARGIANRIRRQDKEPRFHGILTLRPYYLPQWLGGEITWSPLFWEKRLLNFPPRHREDRLKDFRRVIEVGAKLAAPGETVDICSEIFDSRGTFRDFGRRLLYEGFGWARQSNPCARLFLSEILGNSLGRWLQILDYVEKAENVDGIALQVHRSTAHHLPQVETLLRRVLDAIRRRGFSVQISEAQVWLPRSTPVSAEAYERWSQFHRRFYLAASQYAAEQYVVWGACDPSYHIPFGGHSAGAHDADLNPKPFLTHVRTYGFRDYPRLPQEPRRSRQISRDD